MFPIIIFSFIVLIIGLIQKDRKVTIIGLAGIGFGVLSFIAFMVLFALNPDAM
jgi:hypothetical protein